jgi:hypothetical protein
MPSKREVPADKLAALARYDAANGFTDDPKVTNLKAPKSRASTPAPAKRPYRKKMTNLEYRDSLIKLFRLKHLEKADDIPAYDVTRATRYPEVVMWKRAGDERLDTILKRYEWVMKPQGVTADDFKNWREYVMLMNHEQLGALVRVNERTVRNWENGTSEIPFSMWWVMHSTLQDPEYFLTRPGFHDFYIGYDHAKGEATLCSYTWPDIKATPTDLYVQRAAVSEVGILRYELEQKKKEIADLTAQNTQLRQLLKAGTVAAELAAMHEHIGTLLKKMHTADIVEFPETATAAVIDFPHQATA